MKGCPSFVSCSHSWRSHLRGSSGAATKAQEDRRTHNGCEHTGYSCRTHTHVIVPLVLNLPEQIIHNCGCKCVHKLIRPFRGYCSSWAVEHAGQMLRCGTLQGLCRSHSVWWVGQLHHRFPKSLFPWMPVSSPTLEHC